LGLFLRCLRLLFLLRLNLLDLMLLRLQLLHAALMGQAAGTTAQGSDFRHVPTITAYGQSTFAPGFGGFGRVKFMGPAAEVCGLSAFAGDGALLLLIHRSEAAIADARA